MTHTLVRDGTREYVTPVAYVPFRATYTYWERRVGYRPVYPTPGTIWGYDPATGHINAFSGPGPWLERFEYDVLITVPGQAEVKEVTGGWMEAPPSGWTSFAYSNAKLPGSGNATFKVPVWVRGVAIGLTSTPTAVGAGYGHIPHGLLFQDGRVYNLRTGADYGPNSTAFTDVWGITATGTDVVLKKNGSTLASETSTLPNAPLSLASVLFSANDTVDNPTMDSTFTGAAAMTMALGMYGVAGAHAQALMTLPAITMLADSSNVPEIRLAMFAAESTDGYGAMVFPPITLAASSAPLPPQPPTVFLPMEPFVMTAYMLTGEIATGSMTVPAFAMMGTDYDYAGAFMTFPPITMNAWVEGDLEAYVFEGAVFASPSAASATILALAMSGIQIATTAVPNIVLDALARSIAGVHDSALTRQILSALAYSFANMGATVVVPGVGNETWVFNPASEGTTTYSNYGFNSFAKIGDRYYGANETGIYELAGDKDDGAAIRASVNLGKLNFGSSVKKTVEQVYIGMSSSGNIFVKLTAEGQSYVYKTRDFSEELQQQRVTPGKGLRTNYVTLELYNENGADFEVDSVEFVVADMTRKI